MTAANYDITVERGATFALSMTLRQGSLTGQPVDLTGYTAAAMIRQFINSEPVAVMTTDNDGITLGGTAGTIAITIPATETEEIAITRGVWQLELYSGDYVRRLLSGSVRFTPEVVRD